MIVKPDAETVKSLLNYDAETGAFTWKVKTGRYGRFPVGSVAGWVNGGRTPYRYIRLFKKQYRASHLAWLISCGKWPDNMIDHIDCDRLNDKLVNLRQATAQQNSFNKGTIWNKYGLKGVSKKRNLWRSQITKDGKRTHIGYFPTKEEAHAAYYLKATELFENYAHP